MYSEERELRSLAVKPGDIVVLKFSQKLDNHEADRIGSILQYRLAEYGHEDVLVLVLSMGEDLSIADLDEQQMEQAGWVRKDKAERNRGYEFL